MYRLLFVPLLVFIRTLSLAANPIPKLYIDVKVEFGGKKDLSSTYITGSVYINGWETGESRRCLYLPFNDPANDNDYFINYHLKHLNSKSFKPITHQGYTTIKSDSTTDIITSITPYLWEISGNLIATKINFKSKLPRRPNSQSDDMLFNNYHPIFLKKCPIKTSSQDTFQRQVLNIQAPKIQLPTGWSLILPQKHAQQSLPFKGHHFAFGAFRGAKLKKTEIEGVKTKIYYYSSEFLKIIPTVQTALRSHLAWFGFYPYPELIIVESSQPQYPRLPGIISFNKPRQALFNSLQSKILNWSHWAIISNLAMQWYGTAISVKANDMWMVRGIIDFVTLQALKDHRIRYNLFNTYDMGYSVLSLNYLEGQNITAVLLDKYYPNHVLTDSNLNTKISLQNQHPLFFIKHAIALRFLNGFAGESNFKRFFRKFTINHLHKTISPRVFYSYISKLPSPFCQSKRIEMQKYLTEWWTLEGWPDLSFKKMVKKRLPDGRWIADIYLEHEGSYSFPVQVETSDLQGEKYPTIAKSIEKNGKLATAIITKTEPMTVTIDPAKHIFDKNRFNNKNTLWNLNFFPGSANSLKDDEYTVIWLPYPFRRASQKVAIGIQMGVFRYIDNVLFIKFEKELSTSKNGFTLVHRDRIKSAHINYEVQVDQNFANHRLSQVALQLPFTYLASRINFGALLRERRIIGQPKSAHGTGALQMLLIHNTLAPYPNLHLVTEYERAPKNTSPEFQYERKTSVLTITHRFANQRSNYQLRLFAGAMVTGSDVPLNVLFNPEDIKEGHLRLDVRGVRSLKNIFTINNDLLFGFALPLPEELLILNRRLRIKLFYDYGTNFNRDYILRSYGTGLVVPFGGDLTNSGSLALSRLTLLAILFSDVAGQKSYTPRILFSFTGEL